ncbi:hypothetical protein [Sphingobium chungbukense]|uniref:Uncharacterized protein n=1 Tax=Sphingobium chungbukense TaxID=56193 RepID=A0A0M3AUM2_9SPHN|nr:hypothetical protein [Sphingobium chungbukense]KKW92249.1 hypothetical protein YP76_09960 [Sphingobium chungbukense]
MAGNSKAAKSAAETTNLTDPTPPTGPDEALIVDPVDQRDPTPVIESLPTAIDTRTPVDLRARVKVVDADSGEPIEKVIAADVAAGQVTRFAVENGNLVRKNDRFVTITEDRSIRFEWAEGVPAE